MSFNLGLPRDPDGVFCEGDVWDANLVGVLDKEASAMYIENSVRNALSMSVRPGDDNGLLLDVDFIIVSLG